MDRTVYRNFHLYLEARVEASSARADVVVDDGSGLVMADSRRTAPAVGTSPTWKAVDAHAGGTTGRAQAVEVAAAAAEAAGRSRISVGPGSLVWARATACSRAAENAMTVGPGSQADCICRTEAA